MDKFHVEKFSQDIEFMSWDLRMGKIQIGGKRADAIFQKERIIGAKIRQPEETLWRLEFLVSQEPASVWRNRKHDTEKNQVETGWMRLEHGKCWLLVQSLENLETLGAQRCFFFYCLFFFFFFFWLSPQHIEFPGPGIKPMPQQPPKPLPWKHWILNLLRHRTPGRFLKFQQSIHCLMPSALKN